MASRWLTSLGSSRRSDNSSVSGSAFVLLSTSALHDVVRAVIVQRGIRRTTVAVAEIQ